MYIYIYIYIYYVFDASRTGKKELNSSREIQDMSRTVVGSGEKSLLKICIPGSELRLPAGLA